MICFECERAGENRDAIGICHHCSAGLCSEHARTVDDPVTAVYAVCKTVVLPKRARMILCEICRAALEQARETGARVAY